MSRPVSAETSGTHAVSTISGNLGGTDVISAIGSDFGSTRTIKTVSRERGGTGVVVSVRSDSRVVESSRASAVVPIGGEGVGGQDGKGQGEDQFGFHGSGSRFVGVLPWCEIHTTPDNLIKKCK
jgi:hypothetical protein